MENQIQEAYAEMPSPSINEINFRKFIEESKTYSTLTGTDKFKQKLILKNYRNIYHDFEQAKRLGLDYVKQYSKSSIEIKLIEELLNNK
ncbi:hypothetical protein [uncultured Flavobacterium sp.]|uniref:hypothetical protein n=1 Tax=uncultured Flavobacterium sp. TaxID=165435 RepID=UPI0030EE79BA|tara:strand:+ start:27447 stop:27713 length:267 start_codon:yes stop_codon:yes gene_type:complete